MVDRLRALLEEPLDPRAGRAVLVLASTILLGFAALFILAAREPEESSPRSEASKAASPAPSLPPVVDLDPAPAERRPAHRQDPQDEEGSAAGRRAERALRSHRVLQHVPYRRGRVAIVLVGARGSRAVLRVSAPTVAAARQGWRSFLRRFRDAGQAYLPVFRGTGGRPNG